MDRSAVPLLSFVASHSCTLYSLLSIVQNVQVSDTTGDATKN
jgi:hypothetical protein